MFFYIFIDVIEYLPTSLSQVKSLQHIYLNQIHEFPKVLLDMYPFSQIHI